jgi:hypothetical protein
MLGINGKIKAGARQANHESLESNFLISATNKGGIKAQTNIAHTLGLLYESRISFCPTQ